MSKVTHKYNKNQQKLACGRDRTGITGIQSAFNWNEVTCKACLRHMKVKESVQNPVVHRYSIMGKTMCGIESAGHKTGDLWQITCEKCWEALAEKHETADDSLPEIIHLQKAEDGVSWCGNYGRLTEDINKCNCANCKNRISDEIKGIICKPANVYTPADIQKLLTNAYVESGNKGKPVNIPMQEDFLALAMMKAGSIGADLEKIMDANKQNRMVRLIINGLRVELKELRSYLQKHQEQLEEHDEH